MSEKRSVDAGAVSFSERLASSQLFATLFRDGMELVDETASYLDGAGRLESKKLERSAGLVYATESLRLTNRLMHLASWLLLHRAVKEGEITLAQAHKEKNKVSLAACEPGDPKSIALLPPKLQDLIARSAGLQSEVRRLDATMHAATAPKIVGDNDNPVWRQLGLLRAAFESDVRRSGT
jgi:regulator of CtrA degradation